mmetsp:Transcript_50371/g.109736  ORF Transcript_50371/g.109736 Transcript_50371/m.109736 type:complete len:299 (+) Transcript_50371:666-1562(+)
MTGSFVLFSTIHGIGAGHLEPTRPSHVMSASTPWPNNVKVPRAHEVRARAEMRAGSVTIVLSFCITKASSNADSAQPFQRSKPVSEETFVLSRTAVKRSELSCYSQKRRSSWWTGSLQRLLSRILPPWISSRGASKRFGARTAHNMDGTNACTHTPTRTGDVGQNWDTVVNLVQSGPSMSEKNCTTMSDAPMDCGAALLTVPRSSYIILSTTRRCPALTGRARALALEDPSVPFFTDRKSSATSLRSKKTLWKVVFPRSCQFWRLKLPFLGGSRLWKAVILEWTAQLLQQPVLMEPLR